MTKMKPFNYCALLVLCIVASCIVIFSFVHLRLNEKNDDEEQVKKAINRIIENGGAVSIYDREVYYLPLDMEIDGYTKGDLAKIDGIGFEFYDVPLEDIRIFKGAKNLKIIGFGNANLTDEHFSEIAANMNNVEKLTLYNETLTLKGAQYLHQMPKLAILALYNVTLTDDKLKGCAGLPIDYLWISDMDVSESDLCDMLPLDNLTTIGLYSTAITDEITSFLDSCPNLSHIWIFDAKIKCTFFHDMKFRDKVLTIQATRTNIDDDILSSVVEFKNLKDLELSSAGVTEISIPMLKKLSKRTNVTIFGDSFNYIDGPYSYEP